MTELDIMLQGLPEERQKAIREKADRMDAYINSQGVLLMKDKDEEWVDCMLEQGESLNDFTKLDKEVTKKVTLNGGW